MTTIIQANWLVTGTTDRVHFAAFPTRVCQDSFLATRIPKHIRVATPLLTCTSKFLFILPWSTVCGYIYIYNLAHENGFISLCVKVQDHLPLVYRENVIFIILSIEELIFFLPARMWGEN